MKSETIAGRVARCLLAAVFLLAGGLKLAAIDFEVESFAHFGYAPWFMYLIGGIELLGGILLLLPRRAPLGAVAMLPIMVGAGWSHVAAGDGLAMAAPAAVLFALLAAFAWFRRSALAGFGPRAEAFAG